MTDKDKTVTGMIAAEDRQGLLTYGLSAQAALSEFSGDLLDQMRKAKTGEVETPLARLMDIVQSADISGKAGRKSDRQMKKTLLHYGKTDREVFHIEMTLDALRSELLRDIVRLSKLKEKNNAHQQILEQFIETGDNALKTVPESSAQDATHPGHILEKRVHDLKLARMISLQMTPQIDLILSASQTLVDKIQTSLLTTIPLWRSQMTIASALVRQKTAADIEKITVNSAADRLASNNASLKAELERLKSGGGSQEAFDRLRQTGEQLIQTIAECRDISNQSNADNERVQAEIISAKNEINEI